VMHEGQLHQWDDAYTLYHRPATRFVADFIGHGIFTRATLREVDNQVVVQTPLGDLADIAECPLPSAFEAGECDVLLRADDIVHDDDAPVKAQILRKAFRGSEFLYTLRLKTGETVLAHVPSHHDHKVGEWIGIRAEVDNVVTFGREPACPPARQA
jgi:iron(III) transport system ATP-binding protein